MMTALKKLAPLLGHELLHSPWVQRLGRVSFLGALDCHPHSHKAFSRLDHSLGVAELGLQVAESLQLPLAAMKTFVAACLLHDVGHFPLSHAAEAGFAQSLGVAHHSVSEWIICGNGDIPRNDSLRPVLEACHLDPEAVWSVIVGQPEGKIPICLAQLLLAPINLDTLDGIVRAARAFRMRGIRMSTSSLFCIHQHRLWLRKEILPLIDRFWLLKDKVYTDVINLPSNVVCEARLCAAVAQRYQRDIFASFTEFDDAHLHDLLTEHAQQSGLIHGHDQHFSFQRHLHAEKYIKRIHKRYFVDRRILPNEIGLVDELWPMRYRHERQIMFLVSHTAATQLALPGFMLSEESPIPGFSTIEGAII